MGICQEDGLAEVRLRTDMPEILQPTLISGCGAGISYNLPTSLQNQHLPKSWTYCSNALFQFMHELQNLAEKYRDHGGIHSSAIGDTNGLQLFAEDIGRHSTLDRLAVEALFRWIDLQGKMLVTSGRVSAEMVTKAARLGIGLLASRPSPTDRAVERYEQAGITLIGHLRGRSLVVFSHPHQLEAGRTDHRGPRKDFGRRE